MLAFTSKCDGGYHISRVVVKLRWRFTLQRSAAIIPRLLVPDSKAEAELEWQSSTQPRRSGDSGPSGRYGLATAVPHGRLVGCVDWRCAAGDLHDLGLAGDGVREKGGELLKTWLAKPGSWTANPLDAFTVKGANVLPGVCGVLVLSLSPLAWVCG